MGWYSRYSSGPRCHCEAPKLDFESRERVGSVGKSKKAEWHVKCFSCGNELVIDLVCALPWNKEHKTFKELITWANKATKNLPPLRRAA